MVVISLQGHPLESKPGRKNGRGFGQLALNDLGCSPSPGGNFFGMNDRLIICETDIDRAEFMLGADVTEARVVFELVDKG